MAEAGKINPLTGLPMGESKTESLEYLGVSDTGETKINPLTGKPLGNTSATNTLSISPIDKWTQPAAARTKFDLGNETIEDFLPYGVIPQKGVDIYESRGRRQTIGEQLGYAPLRLIGSFGAKVGESVGHVLGAGAALTSEIAEATGLIPDNPETISMVTDNAMAALFSHLDEGVKNALPIHHQKQYLEGNFLDKISTLGFWTDDFIDGLAFLASAWVPGLAVTKAGAGVAAAKGLSRFGKTLAASKVGRLTGKVPKMPIDKLTDNLNIGATFMLQTISEAGFEARETQQRLLAQNVDSKKAAEAAYTTFWGNMMALAPSNLLEVNMLFRTFGMARRGISKMPRKLLEKEAKALTRKQKWAIGAKTALGTTLAEGPYEENIQLAISNLSMAEANGEDKVTLANIAKEMIRNFTTTEGQTNIFLGSVLGGLFGTGAGYTQQVRKHDAQMRGQRMRNNSTTKFMDKVLNLLETEQDEEGNLKYKIDPDTGETIKNKEAVLDRARHIMHSIKNFDQQTMAAIMNSPELYELSLFDAFAQWAYPHLVEGRQGLNYLKDKIDLAGEDLSNKVELLLEEDVYGNKMDIDGIKNKLKQYADELYAVKESTDLIADSMYGTDKSTNKAREQLRSELLQEGLNQHIIGRLMDATSSKLEGLKAQQTKQNSTVDAINEHIRKYQARMKHIKTLENTTIGSKSVLNSIKKEARVHEKAAKELIKENREELKELGVDEVDLRKKLEAEVVRPESVLDQQLQDKEALMTGLDASMKQSIEHFKELGNEVEFKKRVVEVAKDDHTRGKSKAGQDKLQTNTERAGEVDLSTHKMKEGDLFEFKGSILRYKKEKDEEGITTHLGEILDDNGNVLKAIPIAHTESEDLDLSELEDFYIRRDVKKKRAKGFAKKTAAKDKEAGDMAKSQKKSQQTKKGSPQNIFEQAKAKKKIRKKIQALTQRQAPVVEKIITEQVIKNAEFIKLDKSGKFYTNTKTGKKYQRVSDFISTEKFVDTIGAEESIESYKTRLKGLKNKEGKAKYTAQEITNKLLLASSQMIGRDVDELVRDFFNDKVSIDDIKAHDVAAENTIKDFLVELQTVKENAVAMGEKIIASGVVLYNDELGIAGTVDLLTYTPDGQVRIYDMKTMRGNNLKDSYKGEDVSKYDSTKYGKSKREKHREQLSLYRILLNNTHGLVATTIAVMPIEVGYNAGDTTTSKIKLLKGVGLIPSEKVGKAKMKYPDLPHEKVEDDEDTTEEVVDLEEEVLADGFDSYVEFEIDVLNNQSNAKTHAQPLGKIINAKRNTYDPQEDLGQYNWLEYWSNLPIGSKVRFKLNEDGYTIDVYREDAEVGEKPLTMLSDDHKEIGGIRELVKNNPDGIVASVTYRSPGSKDDFWNMLNDEGGPLRASISEVIDPNSVTRKEIHLTGDQITLMIPYNENEVIIGKADKKIAELLKRPEGSYDRGHVYLVIKRPDGYKLTGFKLSTEYVGLGVSREILTRLAELQEEGNEDAQVELISSVYSQAHPTMSTDEAASVRIEDDSLIIGDQSFALDTIDGNEEAALLLSEIKYHVDAQMINGTGVFSHPMHETPFENYHDYLIKQGILRIDNDGTVSFFHGITTGYSLIADVNNKENPDEATATSDTTAASSVDLMSSLTNRIGELTAKREVTDEEWTDTINQEEIDFIKETLPLIDTEINDDIIDAVLRIIDAGGTNAHGIFHQGAIYLRKNAEIGTGYHEAFHAVFRIYLSQEEREKLYKEQRSIKGNKNKTDLSLEEDMAEGLRELMLTEGTALPTTIRGKVWEFLKHLYKLVKYFAKGQLNTYRLYHKIRNRKLDQTRFQRNLSEFITTQQFQETAFKKITEDLSESEEEKAIDAVTGLLFDHLKTRMQKGTFKNLYNQKINLDEILTNIKLAVEEHSMMPGVINTHAGRRLGQIAKFFEADIDEYGNITEGFREKVKETLSNMSINMQDFETKTDENGGKSFKESYLSRDPREKIATELRVMLSLVKQYAKHPETGELVEVKDENFLNLPAYVDFYEIHNKLLQILKDVHSFTKMKSIIHSNISAFPALKGVADLLNSTTEQMKSLFFTQYSLQQKDFIDVLVGTNDKGQRIYKVSEANRNTIERRLMAEWSYNADILFTYNADLDRRLPRDDAKGRLKAALKRLADSYKSKKSLAEKYKDFKQQLLTVLNGIGVPITEVQLEDIYTDAELPQLVDFIESFSRLFNAGKDPYENVDGDSDARAAFSRDINKIIDKLSKYSVNLYGGYFVNRKGDGVWTINLPTLLGKTINQMKSEEDFEEIRDDMISHPIFNPSMSKDNLMYASQLISILKDPKTRSAIRLRLFSAMDLDKASHSDFAKDFSDLNDQDAILMSLATFFNEGGTKGMGYIRQQHADRAQQAHILLPKLETELTKGSKSNLLGSSFIKRIYMNMALQEMARINQAEEHRTLFPNDLIEEYDVDENGDKGAAFEFQYLPFLNDVKELYDKDAKKLTFTIDGSMTVDSYIEAYNKAKKTIEPLLDKYLRDMVDSNLAYLVKLGVIKENSKVEGGYENILMDVTTISHYGTVRRAIENYTINQAYYQTELEKLFHRDRAFYGGIDKMTKRLYQNTTPGSYGILISENAPFQKGKDGLEVGFGQESTYNNAIIDPITFGVDMKDFQKLLTEQGIVDKDKITSKYEKIDDIADGQRIATQRRHREIGNSRGRVAEDMPTKTFHIEIVKNARPNFSYPHQSKMSVFPLNPEHTKNHPILDIIRQRMELTPEFKEKAIELFIKQGLSRDEAVIKVNELKPIDSIDVKSAVKVGATKSQNINNLDGDALYSKLLELEPTTLKSTHEIEPQTINDAHQRKVPGAQIAKSITNTVRGSEPEYQYDGEFISGDDLKKLYFNTYAKKLNRALSNLHDSLGYTDYSKAKKVDREDESEEQKDARLKSKLYFLQNLKAMLTKEIARKKLHNNFKEALMIEPVIEGGELVDYRYQLGLRFPALYKTFEGIIHAKFAKATYRPTLPGEPLVQFSNFISEVHKSHALAEIKVNVDGKTLKGAEINVPAEFAKHFNLKEGDTLIGYRIPGQGKVSTMPLVIKNILPDGMSHFIEVPAVMTVQMGSDFDIDKLYLLSQQFLNQVINETEERVLPLYKTEKELDANTRNLWIKLFKEERRHHRINGSTINEKVTKVWAKFHTERKRIFGDVGIEVHKAKINEFFDKRAQGQSLSQKDIKDMSNQLTALDVEIKELIKERREIKSGLQADDMLYSIFNALGQKTMAKEFASEEPLEERLANSLENIENKIAEYEGEVKRIEEIREIVNDAKPLRDAKKKAYEDYAQLLAEEEITRDKELGEIETEVQEYFDSLNHDDKVPLIAYDNTIIEAMKAVLTSQKHAEEIIRPLDSAFSKSKLTEYIDVKGIAEDTAKMDLSNPLTYHILDSRNRSSAANIGIYSNHVTLASIASEILPTIKGELGIRMIFPYLKDSSNKPITNHFDAYNFSLWTEALLKDRQNINLDAAKDPIAGRINDNTLTANLTALLFNVAKPSNFEEADYAHSMITDFLNQPIIKEFTDLYFLENATPGQLKRIGSMIKGKYPIKKAYKGQIEAKQLNTDLNKSVGDVTYNARQQFYLSEFIRYHEYARDFNRLNKAFSTSANISSAGKLEVQIRAVEKLSDPDLSFTAKNVFNKLDVLDSAYPPMNSLYINGLLAPQDFIKEEIADVYSKAFMNQKDKITKEFNVELTEDLIDRINGDLFSYAYATKKSPLHKAYSYDELKRLFINPNTNIADQLKKMKALANSGLHPELAENRLVQYLSHDEKGYKHNIKRIQFDNIVQLEGGYKSKMIRAWEALLAYDRKGTDKKGKEEDSIVRAFADDLVTYSYLQNGFTNSTFTFFELVPPFKQLEVKKGQTKSIRDFMDSLSTSLESDVIFANFIDNFVKNNYTKLSFIPTAGRKDIENGDVTKAEFSFVSIPLNFTGKYGWISEGKPKMAPYIKVSRKKKWGLYTLGGVYMKNDVPHAIYRRTNSLGALTRLKEFHTDSVAPISVDARQNVNDKLIDKDIAKEVGKQKPVDMSEVTYKEESNTFVLPKEEFATTVVEEEILNLDEAKKIADAIPAIQQNFKDGQTFKDGKAKLVMQEKFKGKSTMDLVLSGERTRTTRAKNSISQMIKDYGLNKIEDLQGEVVRMTDKEGRTAYVRITAVRPFTKQYQEGTWHQEGWTKEVTDRLVGKYPYALEFELVEGTKLSLPVASGENISSKGSEFAKKLTNVGNKVGITYKGKDYINSEHAYQTWKSGEFNQAGYDLKGGKVKGGAIGDTFSIMTDILTEKLKQHPELVQGINERGGLAYIEQSTHNVIGDKFWESVGQNKFIEALASAYKAQPTEVTKTVKPTIITYDSQKQKLIDDISASGYLPFLTKADKAKLQKLIEETRVTSDEEMGELKKKICKFAG